MNGTGTTPAPGTTPPTPDRIRRGRVVVATDGSSAGTRAVGTAAREAAHRGLDLQIVHVIPSYLPTGPLPMIPDGSLQQNAKDVLHRAAEVARAVSHDLEVVPVLVTGSRVASIAHEAAKADLLVLGARDLTLSERVWTGATVAGATARSHCPVLVVPSDYDPEAAEHGRVTVGLKWTEHVDSVLEAAFDEAEARGAELLVLHSWRMTSFYDDVISNRVEREQWEEQMTKIVDALLVDLRAAHPRVSARTEVVHGQPAHTLVEASHFCDRLFLTRPAHLAYFHHLGATTRAVLRESVCPVVVMPPQQATDDRH